jgi:uncharacterized SAM-binding protein YcdF (DUF218 family)
MSTPGNHWRIRLHVLANLALPSGVALLLFILGLVSRAWWRTRVASWWLLAASGAVTVMFSSGMTAAALMSPLEYRHPTLLEPTKFPAAKHIVVLTGWATDDADMPLSGRMGTSAAYRVLMALELHRDRPDCAVIVTGDPTTAGVMGDTLRKLGVPDAKLRLETESYTTADSAAHLPALVGRDEFFLVTSAGHMPRALGALATHGLAPIPAPTDHQMPRDWRKAELRPAPNTLVVSDLAIHEYLGRLWYRMRGTGR